MQNKYFSCKVWKIYCSVCIAIFLQVILFFPNIWNICPSWTMLILIYWVMISPHQVNIGTGFIIGLLLDIALGSIMGIHALSFSIIIYLIVCKIHFLKDISIWIQSCIIIFLSFINYGIISLITFLFVKMMCSPKILGNCILDGMMWPIVIFFMNKIYNIKRNNI